MTKTICLICRSAHWHGTDGLPLRALLSALQESAELRLPIDMQELNAAAQQARDGGSLAKAEVMLEMRAQLSTSKPWAPMVRAHVDHLLLSRSCFSSCPILPFRAS